MKNKMTTNQAGIKLIALVTAVILLSSVLTISSAFGESASKEKVNVKTADKKVQEKTKKTVKPSKQSKAVKLAVPTDTTVPSTSVQVPLPSIDPLEAQKLACKQKETEREQYECEKSLRSAQTSEDFKQKSKKYVVGPITFYYPGAKVEKSGNVDILNLKFLVENTGSKDNVELFCTGPAFCNYDISDGKTTYKYAANDFTNGLIVLRPGMSKEMRITFGPAIGYGSYVPFKYDPSKQYTFNVKEPWGTSAIPLDLK
jgi:hypothetical protein